jgi:hypothetical protein
MAGYSSPTRLDCYSTFEIAVDRKQALKWLFHQEKAALHVLQKGYMYSESALGILDEPTREKYIVYRVRVPACDGGYNISQKNTAKRPSIRAMSLRISSCG